ncbi:MAG TPA: phospholipase D-like domain-containing protein [Thermoleophilaceae bacterium]|jgi:phosphatidylserine/phosphatidylglycerophosphate/cardiolipin synthase-like enzyme
MPATQFSWEGLDKFKRDGRFIAHYPPNVKAFYSPDDDIHGLLSELLASAEQSIVINMFGYDDTDLDAIIKSKLTNEHVYVQMSLDRSQSKSGKTERQILTAWDNDDFGNSIAIGTSSKHAISHLKMVIVDGIYTVKGSTNWSLGGEQKQDNELTVCNSAVVAAEARAVLDRNHDFMLKQMAADAAKNANAKPPKRASSRFMRAAEAGGKPR